MRKLFTFIVAFLATVSGAVWGQEMEYSGSHDAIEINGGGVKEVTFSDLSINAAAACKITGETTVYLTLKGKNYLTSNRDNAGIYVESKSTLIITKESDGATLTARSYDSNVLATDEVNAAGIGGSEANPSFGTIIIEGGTINAYSWTKGAAGHANGAGIGGGNGSRDGVIIIKGGTINAGCLDEGGAQGAMNDRAVGAAIGGGYNGTVTNIAVLGGTINVRNTGAEEHNAVNIGAGKGSSSAPSIILGNWDSKTQPTINGDNTSFTYTQGNYLNAIGGNEISSNGTVTLPAKTQMYLTAAPTQATLNAHTMKLVKTKDLMEGAHTITVYTKYGEKTPDQVIKQFANLYYGADCTVEVPSNIHCDKGHHFMGWMKAVGTAPAAAIQEPVDGTGTVSGPKGDEGEKLLKYTTVGDASGIAETTYSAVWVDNEMSILVKTETDWSKESAPIVSVTPTNAVSLLDYTFNAGTDGENAELKVPDKEVSFSKVLGKENALTGTPTLDSNYDQPSKTLTGITATVKVKDSKASGVTVNFNPFVIYKYDMLITSASINTKNTHKYNGLDHNGTEGEPDHLLTVKGKIENDASGTEYDLRESVHYRIISYKYNDSPNETSNKDAGVKLKDAGKYAEITIMNLLNNGVKFSDEFKGTTTQVAQTEDEKKTTLSETVNIGPCMIELIPASGQTWKIGTDDSPTISYTPVAGTQILGESITEKVAYANSTSLGLSNTRDGAALTGNPTEKGIYYIVQNSLALADDNVSGFKASNYKLVFKSGVTYIVNKDIKDDEDVTIDLKVENISDLSDWTYDGKEHAITVSVKDGNKDLIKDTDYTLSLTGGIGASTENLTVKNAGTYTVTVTGMGLYTGTKTATFTVKSATITTAKAIDQKVTLGKVETGFNKVATSETVYLPEVVGGETPAFGEESELVLAQGTYNEATTYEGVISISKLELADNVNGNFLASNYVISGSLTKEPGNLTVEADKDIDITDPTGDIDFNNGTMVYNGKTPVDINLSVSIDGKQLDKSNYGVEYKMNNQKVGDDAKLNVGDYTVTVTITNGSHNGSIVQKPLKVTKRPLKVNFVLSNLDESYIGKEIQAADYVSYSLNGTNEGLVQGETPTISGTFKIANQKNANGKYDVTIEGLKIEENGTFLPANYTTKFFVNGQEITVNENGDGTTEIEDPTNPDEGGDGGDGQDPTRYYNIYDVTEYDFIDVSFSRNVVREGGSVNVYLGIPEGLDPAAVTLMFKRSLYGGWENLNTDDDGNYLINNIWTDIYVKAVVDESYIDPNPDENHIYIDLSETNDSIWLYTERKLVEEGKTAVIQAEVAKSCQNKEIRYMYKRTVLGEWKEMPKDYSINQYVVRDITTDIYVKAYFVFDKQDPTTAKNPHHVYADITATCEGLYLDATRHKVADEGDTKVFLYVKKGFETKDARYQFKRGLKGEWEDLVPGIEQNTFQVTDIEGDIYLKGMDAVYTGTEDIDGMVRVYTKDGSLFVYTAQPEEISVVSMTGVTVKRTRQTGLQSYPLNQGIYVVCVGEQVFKVRVK